MLRHKLSAATVPVLLQEAKPYKNDPEILAMTNLVTAYQNNDINDFEKILKQNRQTIMEDTFIREHIEDLLKNIRTQVSVVQYLSFLYQHAQINLFWNILIAGTV